MPFNVIKHPETQEITALIDDERGVELIRSPGETQKEFLERAKKLIKTLEKHIYVETL